MNSATGASPLAGPTPAWSLADAAADLDKVLTGLPTALLEALLRLERAPARGEPGRGLANLSVAGG
jgi:hypothetical protein